MCLRMALPTQTAASLTGFPPQRIHKLIKEKALHGITVRAVQYISKSEFILYISSPEQIASVKNEIYQKALRKCKAGRTQTSEKQEEPLRLYR